MRQIFFRETASFACGCLDTCWNMIDSPIVKRNALLECNWWLTYQILSKWQIAHSIWETWYLFAWTASHEFSSFQTKNNSSQMHCGLLINCFSFILFIVWFITFSLNFFFSVAYICFSLNPSRQCGTNLQSEWDSTINETSCHWNEEILIKRTYKHKTHKRTTLNHKKGPTNERQNEQLPMCHFIDF